MNFRFNKASCLFPLLALMISSCIRKFEDNPAGSFILKGRLIDQCSKEPLTSSYYIVVGYEGNSKHPQIGTGNSDNNGNFEIKCDLFSPGGGIYLMAVAPNGTMERIKEIDPKNGEIVELGDVIAGFSLYMNLKYVIADPKPTDSLFLGNNVAYPDTVIYPIPSNGVVNFLYSRYNVNILIPTAKGMSTHFGLGRAGYENAVTNNLNKVIANEVVCRTTDTTIVVVN